MSASRLNPGVMFQLSAQGRPIVVLDEAGTVIFGNRAWTSLEKQCGRHAQASIGCAYDDALPIDTSSSTGVFAKATVDQAITELLSDQQTVFSQTCLLNLGPQLKSSNLLLTQCKFEDGGRGAVIWMEADRKKKSNYKINA